MSQFDQIIKNIALENEKCNYNPEIDTNWDNLPMEMRLECVKWMDFKTRIRLSATSKTEKSLVEVKKFQFQRLHINFKDQPREWKITATTKFENLDYRFVSKTIRIPDYGFISAILKNGEVKNFRLHSTKLDIRSWSRLLDYLTMFAPFRFERVSVYGIPSIAFFLENCANAKKIDHGGEDVPFQYEEMLNLPSITNINEFRLSHLYPLEFTRFLPGLVQKWIDNDAESGKSVQCIMELPLTYSLAFQNFVDTFAEKFADRIIEKTAKEVRVRMNNEKKQILLRLIGSPYKMRFAKFSKASYEFVSCKVIPSDLPKPEYRIGEEWLRTILKEKKRLDNADDREVWGHLWFC